MAPQPFIGEIRAIGFGFAPSGWALCDGQELAIATHDILFQLIGTTYGGDGEETFALPDLRGRVPIHIGQGRALAASGGVERVKLTLSQLPAHSHTQMGSSAQATANEVEGNVPATLVAAGDNAAYGSLAPFRPLSPTAVQSRGANRLHENRMPFLAINFMISLFGTFPPKP